MHSMVQSTSEHSSHTPTYQYTDFTDPINELRILSLQELDLGEDDSAPLVCKLETYRLDASPESPLPEYFALSYVWGDASIQDAILIETDDTTSDGDSGLRKLDISINLAYALRRLRRVTKFDWKSRRMRLWVDAICINQPCVPERNSQVRIMHRIYRSAAHVWVYPVDISAKLGSRHAAKGRGTMSYRHKTFFSEAYWKRAWVVQEIFFAKEVWIIYGDQETILDFKSWKPGTPLVTGLGFFGQPPRHLQSEVYHLKRIKYTELVDASTGPHLLYNLLWQCRHRRAYLPQDKIYSLMNILPASTILRQDYSKPSAIVYGTFMKEVISEGSRHVPCRPLDFLKPTHNIKTPHAKGLPTWCPDFCEEPDTVDILDNVPATASSQTMFIRNIGRAQSKSEDYQPWLYLRTRCRSDGVATDGPVGTVIPSWDLPISPLLVLASETSDTTTEPATELTIKAMRLGSISQLGSPLALDPLKFTLVLPPEEAIRPWKVFGSGVYKPTLESASLALIKTLLINSRIAEWSQRNQASAAGVLKHIVFGADPDASIASFAGDTPVSEYLAELRACLPGWRFGVTSKGHFAKVPDGAVEGDVVVVPLGSSTPFVLRERKEEDSGEGGKGKWELVGRCFVHGYMTGKAMIKLDLASQKIVGGKGKGELSGEEWGRLRELVERQLESFTLV